jgi:hypothetical protein
MEFTNMNELEITLEKIQKSIERNNKNNSNGRRRFTNKNKKDILEFIQKFELNFNQASDLLSISGNSLKRLHDQSTHQEFKQIAVTNPKKKIAINTNEVQPNKYFTQLQVTLLVLQALLIVERIFAQLVF